MVLSGITTEKMNEAFGEYATADAEIQAITAQMDVEFTAIREKSADRLAELKKQKDDAFNVIQAFAVENKETLFSKKKSMDTAHGVLGFRIGNPKLKTLKGFTWEAVKALLKRANPDYIRTTEEVAKNELLADRDQAGVAELMKEVGLSVAQDETFYLEPKKEETTA